jgi:hypothetical protein
MDILLRENGFRPSGKAGTPGRGMARENLVAAGLAKLFVRPATEEETDAALAKYLVVEYVDAIRAAGVPHWVTVLYVNGKPLQQVRSESQVIVLMKQFLTG